MIPIGRVAGIDFRGDSMETIPEDVKGEIWDFFGDYQGIYLATAEDKRPFVRPVTLAFMDSRFWVFTGTNDAKVRHIRSNPRIEFCLHLKKGDHTGYVRASGKAEVILDKETRMRMAERCEYFDKYWNGLDDPSYTLLEIRIEEVEYLKPGELTAPRYKV